MGVSAELRGAAAIELANKLKRISVDPETWEEEYLDENTGDLWLLDYPESGLHGGGSPRLRRVVPKKHGPKLE